MGFDPRSLERLRDLGRRLPQPLPKPEPPAPAPTAREKRHIVETETDPELLFRELMQASPDGTVPPHLLERLRGLEAQAAQEPAACPSPVARRAASKGSRPGNRNSGDQSLYDAFEALLQDDGDD